MNGIRPNKCLPYAINDIVDTADPWSQRYQVRRPMEVVQELARLTEKIGPDMVRIIHHDVIVCTVQAESD